MNLILWRHAEAEALPQLSGFGRQADMQRALTRRGRKQAEASAHWLRTHLPPEAHVLCSPAVRSRETAAALRSDARVMQALAPDTDVSAVLAAIDWPHGPDTVVLVGHQPWLGRLASLLLAGAEINWSIRKSGIWWLASRTRENEAQIVLRAVIHPEFL